MRLKHQNKNDIHLILITLFFYSAILISCAEKPTQPDDNSSEIKIINCTEFTQYGITFYFTNEQLRGTGVGTFTFENRGKTYTYSVGWQDGCLKSVIPK